MKRMRSKEEIVGIVNEGIEKGEIEAGGTEVIANPTLAGTESALTGLQVGDTKYKVEAGGGSVVTPGTLNAKNDSLNALSIDGVSYNLPTFTSMRNISVASGQTLTKGEKFQIYGFTVNQEAAPAKQKYVSSVTIIDPLGTYSAFLSNIIYSVRFSATRPQSSCQIWGVWTGENEYVTTSMSLQVLITYTYI